MYLHVPFCREPAIDLHAALDFSKIKIVKSSSGETWLNKKPWAVRCGGIRRIRHGNRPVNICRTNSA